MPAAGEAAGVGWPGVGVLSRWFSEKPDPAGLAAGVPEPGALWVLAHSAQIYPSSISLLQILQFATPVLRFFRFSQPEQSTGYIEFLKTVEPD